MAKALFRSVTIDDVNPDSELRGNDTREIVATQASSIKTLANAKEAVVEQQTNLEAKFGDNIASIEEDIRVKADKSTVESLYTLRIQGKTKDGHKMIAGWGLGLEGGKSRAIFNVDEFAIGDSDVDATYAFVKDGNRIIMDEVMLRKLTFTKLVDGGGHTIVTGSKIKADYIEADQLAITRGQVSGLGDLAAKNDISYGLIVGSKPPSNADHTASHTAADTSKVAGTNASTVKNWANNANSKTAAWARANHTTLIDGRKIYTGDAFIDTGMMKNAIINTAKIKDLAVETIKIKGHAITDVVKGTSSGHSDSGHGGTWRDFFSMTVPSSMDGYVSWLFFSFSESYRPKGSMGSPGIRLRIGGSDVSNGVTNGFLFINSGDAGKTFKIQGRYASDLDVLEITDIQVAFMTFRR